MRFELALLSLIAILALATCTAAGENYLSISDMTMNLKGQDAVFEVNYTLDTFAKIYVLALGCGYIEPDLLSLLQSYGNVTAIRADPYSASLLVRNAGKVIDGYSLFDSRPIGTRVAKFTVVYPNGLARTFYNVNATPNVFCEMKNVSI